MSHIFTLLLFFLIITLLLILPQKTLAQSGGQWQFLQANVGVSAMHMQLLNDDRVVIFDRTDFGPSNITLPSTKCQPGPNKTDCTAHSIEYDFLTNTFRALDILSDTWCSSGTTLPDGRLLQSGGFGPGDRSVRMFSPCPTCDWEEFPNQLFKNRWYATNQILPDGRSIIIGGRNQTNYEFFPKTQVYDFPFLVQTRSSDDPWSEDNLYPFVFLNVDGNLFIFANNQSILYDYKSHKVVRTYPVIPGGDPRNYPATGSAVLLPLKNLELGSGVEAEVMICGGTPSRAYDMALWQKTFVPSLNTCGRIKITDPNPTWIMETMPMARAMGDMMVLPNGKVLIINGAGSGSAGWELGRDPVLSPVMYHSHRGLGSRFEVMTATTIPRMYHSSAILLRDGRILVGGSNPHQYYNFTNVLFPTELSLEAFSPPYLDSTSSGLRPAIMVPVPNTRITYGTILTVQFSITGLINPGLVKVTMIRPVFNTHSFGMSQRALVLTHATPVYPVGPGQFQANVITPGSVNLAPPGFYMLFVVHQDIPSPGVWVQIL